MGEGAAAKTSVWWDMDRCAVPRGHCDPHRIVHNVIAAAGCAGPVSIAAYGDAARVAPPVLQALSATGICLTHVPAGSKDTSGKRMLVDMLFWAIDNPPPGNYLLISGDPDFSDLLHKLGMKRYNILLVRPANASSQALAAAAKRIWLWESLAAGDMLLRESPHPHSSSSLLLDRKQNANNSDTFKCSQTKARSEYGEVKRLQKYIQKASSTSTGSTESELDQCSVSSSSSSDSLKKLNTSIPPETPASSKSSNQKSMLSTQSQQVDATQELNGEKPSTSTKCQKTRYHDAQDGLHSELRMGDNNGKAINRHRVKPFHKYVKKTNITFSSASDQVYSVGIPDCPVGSTTSELEQSSVSSSSSSETRGRSEYRKVKRLQKYVHKATNASSLAGNQDRVESISGVSESSTGSTTSELDRYSVLSSSNSDSLKKLNTSIPLETPAFSMPSAQKPMLSTQSQQVEGIHEFILGEKPSTSTECVAKNGLLDFDGSERHYNQTYQETRYSGAQNWLHSELRMGDNNGKAINRHGVKPLQKYVIKKTNITFSSASDQVVSVGIQGRPIGSTTIELDQSSVLSSLSPETPEVAKVDNLIPPETSVLSHSSAKNYIAPADLLQVRAPHEFIFAKKPSTLAQHASRNGTHGFDISTVHYRPTYQQSQSSEAYNGASSAQIQTRHIGSIFQCLADIFPWFQSRNW